MINPRELRKGNLVKCISHLPVGFNRPKISFSKIFEVRDTSVDTNSGIHKYKDIAAIELTEDILLHSGGKKTEDEKIVFNDSDIYNPDIFLTKYEGDFYLCTPDGSRYSVPIKFVHHFQNLYYELKRKEVKIKIPT